jgi:hypothetical protein
MLGGKDRKREGNYEKLFQVEPLPLGRSPSRLSALEVVTFETESWNALASLQLKIAGNALRIGMSTLSSCL